MGPYVGVDYNLTLCPLQSRLPTLLPMGNLLPESTLTLCRSRLYAGVEFIPQSGTLDLASVLNSE
jgi:hypothetical protein